MIEPPEGHRRRSEAGSSRHVTTLVRVVYNIIVKGGQVVHRDVISVDNWAQRSRSFGWPQGLGDIPTGTASQW